ncbi:hypothetical protein DXT97_13580 [Agrobacterium tumefaciens]|nr:hypothetical protein [Agrobacterium tumefaciens]
MGYLFEASLSYKRITAAIQNGEINNTHYSQAALTLVYIQKNIRVYIHTRRMSAYELTSVVGSAWKS